MWTLLDSPQFTVSNLGTDAQVGIMVHAVPSSSNKGSGGIGQVNSASRRDAEKCQLFLNDGHWDEDYQKWNPAAAAAGESETGILEAFLRPDASGIPEPQSFRHVLLCGDSTVSRLWLAQHTGSIFKSGGRCNMMEYFGLSPAKTWTLPNTTIEGPCAHGLSNPFCTDCGACDSHMKVDFRGDKLIDRSSEYIAVEFARDREFQTDQTGTTQETLRTYLSMTFDRDLCIVNSGIHDLMLNITPIQYATNVVEYAEILKEFCDKIIWLMIPASRNDPGQPQDHFRSRQFNDQVVKRCDQLGPQVLLLDLWQISLPLTLHEDNIHHKHIYYEELARLLMLNRNGESN